MFGLEQELASALARIYDGFCIGYRWVKLLVLLFAVELERELELYFASALCLSTVEGLYIV